jgi:integrase
MQTGDKRGNGKRGAVTIHRIHATLSSALTAAERLDLVDYNVASKVELPKVTKSKIQIWEPAQAAAFLRAAAQHRLGALFELEVRTGLRRGELCGLRWEDVNLEEREITARVQLTQVGGDVVEGVIKTDAGQDRVISLDDVAVRALVAWKLHQEIERAEAGAAWQETGRVFTMEDGRELRPAYASRLFDKIVSSTELPDIRFHDLRHLHASMLISKNVPLAVVSKRLGHSTIAVTADLYGHLMRDANRAAANAVSDLLKEVVA